MTKKESIIIYARQKAAITRLSLEQKGVLLDALLTYADGEEPTFEDGMVAVAFDFFRSQIDADSQKWEDVRQKRVEAGKLGGRPKKTNQNQTENKPKEIEANESKQKQKNQMVFSESKKSQGKGKGKGEGEEKEEEKENNYYHSSLDGASKGARAYKNRGLTMEEKLQVFKELRDEFQEADQ